MSAEAIEQFAFCGCASCTGRLDEGDSGRVSGAPNGDDFVLFGEKWGASSVYGTSGGIVTYSIDVTETNGSASDAAFIQAIEDSLRTWSSIANISFVEVETNAELDIRTTDEPVGDTDWAASPSTLGFGGYGAVWNGSGFVIDEGFAFMNAKKTWAPEGGGGSNYLLVAMHEIGHAIGLDHASGSGTQLMNPYIGPEGVFDGDIAGVQFLYGEREWTNGADDVYLKWVNVGQTVEAKGGNDTILATIKADTIYGGAGNDNIDGNAGNDMIFDTLGQNLIKGGNNNDVVVGGSGKTDAEGGSGNDIIIGGKGDDDLDGGNGNDTIRGDAQSSFFYGDDEITAGKGTDFVEGGGGSDTFVFRPNDGTNTIAELNIVGTNSSNTTAVGADFDSGVDTIDLRAFGYGSRTEAFNKIQDNGPNGSARFSDNGTVIIFYDLNLSDLSENDFLV